MLSMDSLLTIKEHHSGYVQHWLYTENGLLVMIIARYEIDGKKTYRQFRLENEEWVEGMSLPPYPLYGLSSLRDICPLDAILITEGEKCTALLHQIGWPAVTTALGAQNSVNSDWHPLRHYITVLSF